VGKNVEIAVGNDDGNEVEIFDGEFVGIDVGEDVNKDITVPFLHGNDDNSVDTHGQNLEDGGLEFAVTC
jgi:hypothetical protein